MDSEKIKKVSSFLSADFWVLFYGVKCDVRRNAVGFVLYVIGASVLFHHGLDDIQAKTDVFLAFARIGS